MINIENLPKQEVDLSPPLTKASHRNPDIHQRGDTLPESLLEYQEGSGTLNPDVAGNTPLMLRSVQTIYGNNAVQALTTTPVQLANFSMSVSCPIQAVGSPLVFLSYNVPLDSFAGAGVTDNWAMVNVYVGGILNANGMLQWSPGTKDSIGRTVLSKSRLPIGITPGATLTIDIRVHMQTNTTPINTYQSNPSAALGMFSAELFY